MQTTTSHQQAERINLLAAGVLTAAGAHLLLNLLGLPKLFTHSDPGAVGILVTSLKVIWALAGVAASGYVLYMASFMLNARSYAKSKLAARGTLILPLIGLAGMITCFALIPVGTLAVFLLRQPLWMAAFDDVDVVFESAEDAAESKVEPAPLVEGTH